MLKIPRILILGISALLLVHHAAYGEEVSKAQIKGLDEQIQDIKTDVLGIASELNQLEEKLLYPSNTQITVFVAWAGGAKVRLDAVEIRLGGKPGAPRPAGESA